MPTPAPATQSSLVSAQAAQIGLATVMAADVQQAFALLDPAHMRRTLPQFTLAIHALTDQYGRASAALAAQFYQAERRLAGVIAKFRVTPAQPPPLTQVDTVMRWATRKLWTLPDDPSALAGAQQMVTGSAQKMSLDVGRLTTLDSVRSDRYARAWAREAKPGCCWFCAMLATRGAVYESKQTAGPNVRGARNANAGKAFVGLGEFKVHDNCQCTAVPVFTSYEMPARAREWEALYRSVAKAGAGQGNQDAFREAYQAKYPPQPKQEPTP